MPKRNKQLKQAASLPGLIGIGIKVPNHPHARPPSKLTSEKRWPAIGEALTRFAELASPRDSG